MNGSSAMAAALQGADLKIIGNSGNKMIFSLYVRPEIKTVEALKGKKSALPVLALRLIFRFVTRSGSTTSMQRGI